MDIKQKLKEAPTSSGVYLMKNKSGEIIYIGKAKNLKHRLSSYFNASVKNEKTLALVSNIADFEYIVVPSESDAFALECNLIQKHQPHYNILLKDGKQFAFLKVNLKQSYPKFCVARKVQKDGAIYFGPYFNGASAKIVLDILKTCFPLRWCNINFDKTKKARRPCLNYHLKKCLGPCINNCREEYDKVLKDAMSFLNGKTKEVRKILEEKMVYFGETENFEEAIVVREQIKSLGRIEEKIVDILPNSYSCDVFAFEQVEGLGCLTMMIVRGGKVVGLKNYPIKNPQFCSLPDLVAQIYFESGIATNKILVEKASGFDGLSELLMQNFDAKVAIKEVKSAQEKKVFEQAKNNAILFLEKNSEEYIKKEEQFALALENLKRILKLKNLPQRIECYDISNTMGTNSVASMVVATNGVPDKKQYRKFKIKTVEGISDFDSLKEVLMRRLGEFEKQTDTSFSKKPDMILIDGGKGQLSSVLSIAKDFAVFKDIDFCSLAKKFETVYCKNLPDGIVLSERSLSRRILTNLRDEAHRFAITFHRNLRSKQMVLKNKAKK